MLFLVISAYRTNKLSSLMISEKALDLKKLIAKEVNLLDMWTIYEIMHKTAKDTLMHENVQKFLLDTTNEYDAVIGEWLYSDEYSG